MNSDRKILAWAFIFLFIAIGLTMIYGTPPWLRY